MKKPDIFFEKVPDKSSRLVLQAKAQSGKWYGNPPIFNGVQPRFAVRLMIRLACVTSHVRPKLRQHSVCNTAYWQKAERYSLGFYRKSCVRNALRNDR